MSNTNRSFSLIELVVVIAIIVILTIMAIPSYRKYEIKANISEGMVVIDMVNRVIAEYYSATGIFPPIATVAARLNSTVVDTYTIPINSKNVSVVSIDDASRTSTGTYYGIGFAFYVPSGSTRNHIYVVVNNNNDTSLTFNCGIWSTSSDSTSYHINDTSYLPNGCNTTNVSQYY